ncbi:hypothetical protein [Bosea sp. (in: a-proteobacteria)]|uniref:hypothetical protein n=1 Tax=Bosea sp. (in: a-proteobacteria) TaxID=1871050 RepID=UPI0025C270F6|nr:hypothetical protein [Bosea sp. (in: a-proteobacteria)]MBR3190438.1 hypothetical protein [Bosea sp. (in: a-proteobacteria)]
MTADAAFDTLREHGSAAATVQFWGTDTPARNFDTLREALLFLADLEPAEPLPDVHVHAATGDLAINGPELEHLIAAAKAKRSAT